MFWRRKTQTAEPLSGDDTTVVEPAAPPPRRRISKWTVGLFLGASGLILTVVAVWTSSQWLPDLSRDPAYQVRAEQIRVSPPPPWVPRDFVQRVLQENGLSAPLSLLDRDLTERIALAFQQYPWVAGVDRVLKGYPAEVSVELRYRYVVAMVRKGEELFPIDERGILLPSQDILPEEAGNYPIITQIRSVPPLKAGERWNDPLVEEAGRIAKELASRWKEFGLKTIEAPDLREGAEDPSFAIRTNGGSLILWGREVKDGTTVELTASQKIGRLDEIFSRYPELDRQRAQRMKIDLRPLGPNILVTPLIWSGRDSDRTRQ